MATRAEKLKIFRIKKGLTQEQIAEKLGYDRNTYSRVENCKQDPTIKFCKAFARAFGMTLDEVENLMRDDNQKTKN